MSIYSLSSSCHASSCHPAFLHFSLLLFSFMSYLTISFFCVFSYVLFTCLHSSASYFSTYFPCPHLPIGIQMSQCSRWTERLKRCVSSTLQYSIPRECSVRQLRRLFTSLAPFFFILYCQFPFITPIPFSSISIFLFFLPPPHSVTFLILLFIDLFSTPCRLLFFVVLTICNCSLLFLLNHPSSLPTFLFL